MCFSYMIKKMFSYFSFIYGEKINSLNNLLLLHHLLLQGQIEYSLKSENVIICTHNKNLIS